MEHLSGSLHSADILKYIDWNSETCEGRLIFHFTLNGSPLHIEIKQPYFECSVAETLTHRQIGGNVAQLWAQLAHFMFYPHICHMSRGSFSLPYRALSCTAKQHCLWPQSKVHFSDPLA